MKTNKPQTGFAHVLRRSRSLLAVATLLLLTMFAVSCGDDDPAPVATDLTITSITPTSGTAGTVVEINGTGFSATASENAVTLNGKACTVTAATTTKLTITVPAAAGSGKITVTVGGKSAQSGTFTVAEALTIASIAPTTGGKGTEVTINGAGFGVLAGDNTVTINGKAVAVKTASVTKLIVVIPAGAGTGPIKVMVGGTTVESASFTYVITTMISTLAGSSSGYEEGTGTAAKFNQPTFSASDKDGNVYVADQGSHRIRKITPAGVTSTLAGGEQGDTEGTGAEAKFNYPYGIATDAAGNVYVADTHNHKIKKITPAGVVTTVAGSTGGNADGTGAEAQFYYPTGLTVGSDGTIYVADKDNHRIRKITTGGVVTTLAGSSNGFQEGNGTAAKFSQPYDVAVDANGNVYVSDTGNHKIRKITAAGEVTTLAGSDQGDVNATGGEAKFNYPYGVATDKDGNVLVADTFNQKVRMITAAGVVTTIAGTTGGSADGDVSVAQFNYLTGVDADASGKIYVTDKDNHRVRLVVTE